MSPTVADSRWSDRVPCLLSPPHRSKHRHLLLLLAVEVALDCRVDLDVRVPTLQADNDALIHWLYDARSVHREELETDIRWRLNQLNARAHVVNQE